MLTLKMRSKDNTPVYVMGLSYENLARLKGDQPIAFPAASLGLGPGTIYIVAGATEEALATEFGIPHSGRPIVDGFVDRYDPTTGGFTRKPEPHPYAPDGAPPPEDDKEHVKVRVELTKKRPSLWTTFNGGTVIGNIPYDDKQRLIWLRTPPSMNRKDLILTQRVTAIAVVLNFLQRTKGRSRPKNETT
jgi:hypothetical protein